MAEQSPFATPRVVTDPAECTFYHSIDIPGHGLVEGEWDLRDDVEQYLGGVDFSGKRVLELGTASGFLCFQMEARGADVVCVDLSEEFAGDLVPFARVTDPDRSEKSRLGTRRFNNAYWFAHRGFESKAKLAHSTAYDIPDAIGEVDIATFGCILEHLRDPFRALQEGSRFAKEAVVVTNVMSRRFTPLTWLGKLGIACNAFLPRHEATDAFLSWWVLSPEFVRRAVSVLGFEDTTTSYHSAIYNGRRARLFTVVGRRTHGAPSVTPYR